MTAIPAVETISFAPRAPATWFDQVGMEREEWVIDRLVPSRSYTGVFGRRGAAKSFLALELACCGALGMPFLGERCAPFGTIYAVGEKKSRFGKRVEAWRRARGHRDIPVMFRWGVPNLLDDGEVDDFIAELTRLEPAFAARNAPLRVVILDTLSRALRGANVSDADATGKALNAIQRIIDQTGVTVIPLAHVAKDADRASVQKGAGEWEDAADALIRIDRKEGEDVRVVTLTKQSDEADGLAYAFELDVIDLAETDAGTRVTSCVIRQVDVPDSGTKARPKALSAPCQLVLRALARCVEAGQGEVVPFVPGLKRGTQGVRRNALRQSAYDLGLQKASEPEDGAPEKKRDQWLEARKKAFQRAHDQLVEAGKIGTEGDWTWQR